MFVAAWSFDMQYGTRQETFSALKEMGAAIQKVPGWKAKNTRILWGSIGAPESRIVLEHEFASLAELESSWQALQGESQLFSGMIARMKALIVPASPRWEVYRVLPQ